MKRERQRAGVLKSQNCKGEKETAVEAIPLVLYISQHCDKNKDNRKKSKDNNNLYNNFVHRTVITKKANKNKCCKDLMELCCKEVLAILNSQTRRLFDDFFVDYILDTRQERTFIQ